MRFVKKRTLEILLSSIPGFPEPKITLEQYVSPPHLASRLVWVAAVTYGDIAGARVLDLGAGTGRLGIGAALMGASQVVLLDVDREALKVSREAADGLGVSSVIDTVCSDVKAPPLRPVFDVVIQNPPFGVHRRGADMDFLHTALSLGGVVYSVHKLETKDFIVRKLREIGGEVEILFGEEILLPPIYKFHYKNRHKVDVVVIRAERKRK